MIEERLLDRNGNSVWSVTTAPALEPITVDEAKLFARIDGSDEDALIGSFITSARENCEAWLGRALIEQTITMHMDYWPGGPVELPRPPLISVTAIETLDEDDVATVYSSANYYVITISDPGTIIIRRSASVPYQTSRDYGSYRIRYKAGYGTAASSVPAAIKEGLKLWVTDAYENRVVRDDPPPEAMSFMRSYRMLRA